MLFATPFPLHVVANPVGSDHLILFLHGLDGHWSESWGQPGSPGSFMHRISAHFANAVVASVAYPSSMAGFATDADRTVPAVAEAWADQLATNYFAADCSAADCLGRYASIAFVTHCLGGLVTLQALRRLAERGLGARQGHKVGKSALQGADGQANTRLFCLLMDTPLRWPSQVLPEPKPILRVMHQLGITEADLAANLAYFASPEGAQTLQLASVASSVPNWLSPFDPLALAQPATRWSFPVRHEDMSRAPARGPFEPVSIAVQWLEKFSMAAELDHH